MASVFKQSGRRIYQIKYIDQHGVRRNEMSGMIDRRAAEGLAHMIEQDADRIRAGMLPAHPAITGRFLGLDDAQRAKTPLAEAIAAYLADLSRRGKSAATHRHRRYKLQLIVKECRWSCLADITASSLTRYLSRLTSLGRAPSTANAYQDTLSAFVTWCVTQGWLEKNPLTGKVGRASAAKIRPHRRRAFTPEELRRLLVVARRHRDRYLMAGLTGLRSHELTLIRAGDFDLAAKVWTCRAEVDKGGRAWRLPILPDLIPTLERLRDGKGPADQLFPKRIGNGTLDSALRRAQIAKIGADGRRLNFHSLRYFFCTLLASKLPIQVVQRLMRHSDIRRTVNLYLDLGLDDLAAQVADLPPLFTAEAPQPVQEQEERRQDQSTEDPKHQPLPGTPGDKIGPEVV